LWEADSGRPLGELRIGDADVAFSPDGRRLYTATGRLAPGGAECVAWRRGSWQPERRLALQRSSGAPTALAVAPDRTVAVAFTLNDVRLLDPDTFEELATLTSPQPQTVSGMRFSPHGGTLAIATGGPVHLW